MHKKDERDLELALLKSVNNDYELDTIKALLEEKEIPFIVKDQGVGGYMRIIGGSSIYGTDILVEESMLEEAKELIDKIFG